MCNVQGQGVKCQGVGFRVEGVKLIRYGVEALPLT